MLSILRTERHFLRILRQKTLEIHANSPKTVFYASKNLNFTSFYQQHSIAPDEFRRSHQKTSEIRHKPFDKRETESFGELIYEGSSRHKKLIVPFKILSLISSFTGLGTLPVILSLNSTSTTVLAGPVIFGMCAVIVPFCTLTPVGLHWLAKRFVVDMYYDDERQLYTAVTFGFFGFRRIIQFRTADLNPPGASGMLASVLVGSRKIPILLNPEGFVTDADYEQFYNVETYGLKETDDDDDDYFGDNKNSTINMKNSPETSSAACNITSDNKKKLSINDNKAQKSVEKEVFEQRKSVKQ